MRIGVKPGQWGWGFDELRESWMAAEDAGLDLVSCFDHVTSSPAGEAAWDAPTLLAAIAASTTRAAVAVHVVNASLRHPFLLAGQLAVAQAASGGRVELGLGAGSFHLARFDHRATGVAFPDWEVRLRRLESVATTLPKLWRGETVDDDELGLRGASLGPLAIEPPRVVIGGASEGAMAVAARHADGWNGSDPDPHAYAPLLERLERACEREGRERPIERQVQLWLRDVGLEHLRERLHAFRDLGVDTAIVVLDGERGAEWVRRIADAALR